MSQISCLAPYFPLVRLPLPKQVGWVTQIMGILVEGQVSRAAVGDFFDIDARHGRVRAEVVALKSGRVVLLPYGQMMGLEVGCSLTPSGRGTRVPVGPQLLGRVLDALGHPLDGGPVPHAECQVDLYMPPLALTERAPVRKRLATGVRALDVFVPLGEGQRIGIFAGPGVGKSTLVGMLTRGCDADVVVLALVGERGREVGHFVEEVLGEAGLKKSVVISATSDRPASERVRAAFMATSVAEYFRDSGKRVLLFVDSLTRLCMAQRDIGLAIGEPPTSKGYPPSAFSLLPRLLERAAPKKNGGTITGIYTILVEGDDMTEPVADAARGLLDGHVVLSRSVATRGHFPAVDVLESLSRLESDLMQKEELTAARTLRKWLSLYEESRELIAVGAYKAGQEPELDLALKMIPKIATLTQQSSDHVAPLEMTRNSALLLSQGAA